MGEVEVKVLPGVELEILRGQLTVVVVAPPKSLKAGAGRTLVTLCTRFFCTMPSMRKISKRKL